MGPGVSVTAPIAHLICSLWVSATGSQHPAGEVCCLPSTWDRARHTGDNQ